MDLFLPVSGTSLPATGPLGTPPFTIHLRKTTPYGSNILLKYNYYFSVLNVHISSVPNINFTFVLNPIIQECPSRSIGYVSLLYQLEKFSRKCSRSPTPWMIDSTAPRTQHMALLMEDHIQGRKGEETRFLFLYLMGWERSGHLIWAGGLFNVQLAGGCSWVWWSSEVTGS